MKLKELMMSLNTQIKLDPTILERELMYVKNDEGNDYNLISFEPTLGLYDGNEREYISEDDILADDELYDNDNFKDWIKVICIN